MTDSTDTEPMALAGLRRLVLHARDKLAAATLHRPNSYLSDSPALYYTDAVIARALAVEVLTLVADCLPAPDPETNEESVSSSPPGV